MTEARVRRLGTAAHALVSALATAGALTLAMIVISLAIVTQSTKRGTDRLVDCTTPGGKCYEQGRSASSSAVGTINKVTIAAIYCSGKLGPRATIDALQSCVMAQVKP